MLRAPLIDAHHHLGATAPSAANGLDALWPELQAERVSGTILAVAEPSVARTRELLALAAGVPWVKGVVGWVDLAADDVGETIAALQAGAGGSLLVGLRCPARDQSDPAWLARAEVGRGLEIVADTGLAVDLGVGPRELAAALEACAARPDLRFVLEHLAGPPIASGDLSAWGRGMLELAELPNVSATLSGLVAEADPHTWSIDDLRHPIELAVDAFGTERLMVGSDWPDCLASGTYADVIESVRYLLAELPVHQQHQIEGATAVRVYRLSEP